MAEAQPLLPGDPERLGDYELVGRLGEGGQGVVYLGRGPNGEDVAVKLLLTQLTGDAAARSRFVRELAVAERVAGFCTAQVLDADAAGDRPYIVSEYVPGPSLKDLVLSEGPRTGAALMRLAIGTATALAAIHQAGIVHRDFKPLNVLMGPDGPRVIDFGVARALDSSGVTMTSQVVGTPAYMAPEQLAGGIVSPAADMFAWASTMMFAATGDSPFGSDSIPAVMHRIMHLDPDLSVLPEPLRELVTGCLRKDPVQRPTAHAVLLRLLGGMEGPAAAPAGGRLEPALTHGASAAVSDVTPPGWRPPPPPPPYALREGTTVPPGMGGRPRHGRRTLVMIGAPVGAVLLAAAAVTGYTAFAGNEEPGSGPPTSVKIGFAGALSGAYAPLVQPMLNGAKLALKEYNAANPRIAAELVVVDTQGRPEATPAAANKLVGDKVVAVIGPPFSAEAESAGPILDRARIPSIATSATGRALSARGLKYWHRLVPSDQTVATSTADFLIRAAKPKRVFVVDDELKFSQDVATDVAKVLKDRKVAVTRGRISAGSSNLSGTVSRIRSSKADIVFYGGAYEPAARLVKQTHAAGLKARFTLSDAALAAAFIPAAGRGNADGTLITCSCFDASQGTAQASKDFRQRYRTEFGSTPGYYTAEGYDAAMAFLTALKAGKADGTEINRYLATVDLGGASRRVRFGPNGDPAEGTVYAYRVDKARIELLGDTRTASL
jgi:ABC-type branched-subunit amino acid transport system substrate-binding protein